MKGWFNDKMKIKELIKRKFPATEKEQTRLGVEYKEE